MSRYLRFLMVLSLVFLGSLVQAYEFPHMDAAAMTLGIDFNGIYDPTTRVVSITPALTASNGSWTWENVGFRHNGIEVKDLQAEVYVAYKNGNSTKFIFNLGDITDESIKNIRLDIRPEYDPRYISISPILKDAVFESKMVYAGFGINNEQTISFCWQA